jgi:acyl carrier protein
MDTNSIIRDTLQRYGNLAVAVPSLGDDDDLYQAGLTSHASVSVMLSIEDAFDIEFPDAMLTKDTFRSVSSIESCISSLTA